MSSSQATRPSFTLLTRRQTRRTLVAAALVLAAASSLRCGSSSSSPTSPTAAVASSIATTPTAPTATSTTPTALAPLTTAQVEMLAGAIQDEYHAEAVYLGVLADFGQVFPFVNIVVAEQAHAASVARLYTNRGLTPPPNAWSVSKVPQFRSVAEACAAAAEAEIANIELYDEYLATESLPFDVRNVFTNNRAASVSGHLPAFTRCR